MSNLALEHLAAPGQLVSDDALPAEERDRGADRRERIPELVRQRGQERVLPAIGLDQALLAILQRAPELGVLQRHRHRRDEALEAREVLPGVRAGRVAHRLHDPHDLPIELHGHHERAAGARGTRLGLGQIPHLPVFRHVEVLAPAPNARVDVPEEPPLTAPDHLGLHAAARIEPDRKRRQGGVVQSGTVHPEIDASHQSGRRVVRRHDHTVAREGAADELAETGIDLLDDERSRETPRRLVHEVGATQAFQLGALGAEHRDGADQDECGNENERG